MKRVSKEEFYSTVGPLNVHPCPVGNYPYTSLFKTPTREVKGKIVESLPEGKAIPVSEYFIAI